MDINLPGMNGYDTCYKIKSLNRFIDIPVIFISELQDLNDRLKAYGVGGADYISKPIKEDELNAKILSYLLDENQKEKLKKELQESYDTVMLLQNNTANIQTVNRFVMDILFCHNLDSVSELFIKAVNNLNISCVLTINSKNETIVCSDTENISKLEEDIINMSEKIDRIFPFGNNRAIINRENATVLVRNIDDNSDIMALLMDGMEAGIKSIEVEQKLLRTIAELDNQNNLIQDKISNQFNLMKSDLSDLILSMVMISSLDTDEEDKLNDCLDNSNLYINQQFEKLSINNTKLSSLINQLRSPPKQFNSNNNDIDFF